MKTIVVSKILRPYGLASSSLALGIKLKNTDSLSEIKACGESVSLYDAPLDHKAVSLKQEENLSLAKIL